MKKLKCRLWAKIFACVLLTLSALIAAAGICDIAYVSGTGGYSTWNNETMNDVYNDMAYMYSSMIKYMVVNDHPELLMTEDGKSDLIADNGYLPGICEFLDPRNVCYSVTDENGETVYTGENTGEVYYRVSDELSILAIKDGRFINGRWELAKKFTVTVGLTENTVTADAAQLIMETVKLGYRLRYAVFAMAPAAAAVAVLCAVFICSSAGHRIGTDEIELIFWRRIPLEIYLGIQGAAAVGAWCILLASMESALYDTPVLFIFLASFVILFLICQFYIVVFNLAVRIKAGKWYRHTLAFIIVKFLFKVFRAIYRSVPLIWRVLLILAGCVLWSLINMINHSVGMWIFGTLLFCAAAVYITLCFIQLRQAASKLNDGVLSFKVDTKYMPYTMRLMGKDLNGMGDGLSKAVEARTRSDRMKTELITNVTHDIKTPLTSIINYADLLKNEPLEGVGNAEEYVEVISRQSERMKKLIGDLIDVSKASTGNIKFVPEDVDLSVMTTQAAAEYEERFAERGLTPVVTGTDRPAVISADGGLCWRIWDNLLSNACKYSMPGTRVYIDLNISERGDTVAAAFRNISERQLNIPASELGERFVRGDESRSGEGSGLGLSIAQSLASLQGGSLVLASEGDLFRAVVTFPLKNTAEKV